MLHCGLTLSDTFISKVKSHTRSFQFVSRGHQNFSKSWNTKSNVCAAMTSQVESVERHLS